MATDEGMLMVWISVDSILKIININEYGFKKFVELVVYKWRKGCIQQFVPGGAQHPLGSENPLNSIDFTGPGGLSPHSPWIRFGGGDGSCNCFTTFEVMQQPWPLGYYLANSLICFNASTFLDFNKSFLEIIGKMLFFCMRACKHWITEKGLLGDWWN